MILQPPSTPLLHPHPPTHPTHASPPPMLPPAHASPHPCSPPPMLPPAHASPHPCSLPPMLPPAHASPPPPPPPPRPCFPPPKQLRPAKVMLGWRLPNSNITLANPNPNDQDATWFALYTLPNRKYFNNKLIGQRVHVFRRAMRARIWLVGIPRKSKFGWKRVPGSCARAAWCQLSTCSRLCRFRDGRQDLLGAWMLAKRKRTDSIFRYRR